MGAECKRVQVTEREWAWTSLQGGILAMGEHEGLTRHDGMWGVWITLVGPGSLGLCIDVFVCISVTCSGTGDVRYW